MRIFATLAILAVLSPPAAPYDLSWARSFAAPAQADGDHKWDSHFQALMRSSFPQHQHFWVERGRALPVPALVQTFLGVPGGARLDEDRYLTLAGCVPHSCSSSGLVWMDTRGEGKPLVIFAALSEVMTPEGQQHGEQHLWLFASRQLDWQHMPPPLTQSLGRWYTGYQSQWKHWTAETLLLVTLVQPGGATVDLAPALLDLETP
jgi:hypothetical protein